MHVPDSKIENVPDKSVRCIYVYVYISTDNLEHVFNIDSMGSLTNYELLRYILNIRINGGRNIQFGKRRKKGYLMCYTLVGDEC